jgi:hypothetical protein
MSMYGDETVFLALDAEGKLLECFATEKAAMDSFRFSCHKLAGTIFNGVNTAQHGREVFFKPLTGPTPERKLIGYVQTKSLYKTAVHL